MKAFAKVALEPGEEREVCFELSGRDFAYYDSASSAWRIESGDFDILVGGSSDNLRARASIYMDSSQAAKMTFHTLLPIKYFLADEVAAPLFQEVLGHLPLVQTLSPGRDQDSIARIIEELPLAKLVSLGDGTVDDKQLDDFVSLINSKASD